MKTNKVSYTKLATTVAAALMLAVSSYANAAPDKVQPSHSHQRSNLDPATRANHNPLLDPSFYESNHEVPS